MKSAKQAVVVSKHEWRIRVELRTERCMQVIHMPALVPRNNRDLEPRMEVSEKCMACHPGAVWKARSRRPRLGWPQVWPVKGLY